MARVTHAAPHLSMTEVRKPDEDRSLCDEAATLAHYLQCFGRATARRGDCAALWRVPARPSMR